MGSSDPTSPGWLASQLEKAGARGQLVIVVSHQPLPSSDGGESILSLLDTHPRVLAVLSGHTHRNSIEPRAGYWLINTASLIDYPQQARALRILRTAGGGVAIQTWMLDHVFPGEHGHDLPPARLPRRPGRAAQGLRRRSSGPQRDAVSRRLMIDSAGRTDEAFGLAA